MAATSTGASEARRRDMAARCVAVAGMARSYVEWHHVSRDL